MIQPYDSGAVQLTQQNIDMTLASNELVFINFYADWCRFSNLLMPIFDEAAEAVAKEFPENGKVVMGKVDCDKENTVASRFHITKYPTLKVIRNGQPPKTEYRGQRSVEAFTEFIKKQLEDPIREFKELKELGDLVSSKKMIIGFFDRRDQPEYQIFRRVATNLKDDCQFYVGFEEASRQMHPPGQPIIVFRPNKDRSNELDETYPGSLNNFDELYIWTAEKCQPLVREITFENVEELTQEEVPFLILFHNTDDNESVKRFHEIVQNELISEKQSINFLTADGKIFAHPFYHHHHKSDKDLPLIAIDSFSHMYMFPNYKDIDVPGKLKQLIKDLYSGKLHRELHYGPESDTERQQDTPPESTFEKLAPSKNSGDMSEAELQEDEREVLSSIYDGDQLFKEISPNTYQYKYGESETFKSFLLEIKWGEKYPNELPIISMDTFYNKHIIPALKQKIVDIVKEEAEQYIGTSMTYSLFEFIKEKFDELIEMQPDEAEKLDVEKLCISDQEPQEIIKKEKKEQLTKS